MSKLSGVKIVQIIECTDSIPCHPQIFCQRSKCTHSLRTHTPWQRHTPSYLSQTPFRMSTKSVPCRKYYVDEGVLTSSGRKSISMLSMCCHCFINLFITRVKVNNHQYFSSHFPPSSMYLRPLFSLCACVCYVWSLTA